MTEDTPNELAECIDTSGQPAELVGADRAEKPGYEDLVRLTYTHPPNVYGQETDDLLERGFTISGMVNLTSDKHEPEDGYRVFLRPVVETVETVEVEATQVRVEFDD